MSKNPAIDERPARRPATNPDDPLQPTPAGPESVVLPANSDPAPDSPPAPNEPETAPDSLPIPESPRPEEPPLF